MSPDPRSSAAGQSQNPESDRQDNQTIDSLSTAQPGAPSPQPVRQFEEPSYLHPSSIFFEVVTHVRRYIIPAAIGLLSAARGSAFGIWLSGLVFSGALLVTLIRYFTLRYRIQDKDLVITEGLFFRRIRSVPIRRIQNLDLVQNVLHRIFGVAEVRIETASGKEAEAVLRVLTRAQVEQLRAAIFSRRSEASEAAGGAIQVAAQLEPRPDNNADVPQQLAAAQPLADSRTPTAAPAAGAFALDGQLLLAIPLRLLILAGITSNRGMVLLGILVGLFFQSDYAGEDAKSWKVNSEVLEQWLPDREHTAQLVVIAIVALLGLMVLLRAVGIAWYVLRFYGYRLTRVGNDLRISCGLLTRVSATVPRQRIQVISVHRSLIMRWWGLAAVRLETAGGAGRESEDAASTVSRRWFVPVMNYRDVPRLLSELRPELNWEADSTTWHAVSPLTFRRLSRIAILASVIIAAMGLAMTRPWGFVAGIVALPILVWVARKKSRSKRFSRSPCGVAYQSGVFTRKLSFAFYNRFQTLRLSQTPFDRRWHMASLSVDTAAAGPANHPIEIKYLDQSLALQQFEDLQMAAAQHRPSWK